jgi:hypothetical protein
MVGQPEVASTGLPPAGAERFRGHSLKEKGMMRREYNHMPCRRQKLILPSFVDSMPTLASE